MCSISFKIIVASFLSTLFKHGGLGSATPSDKLILPRGREGSAFLQRVCFTWNEASLDDVFIRPPTIIELGCEGLSCGKEAERERGLLNSSPHAPLKSNGCQMGKGISSAWRGERDVQVHLQRYSCALHGAAAVGGGGILVRYARSRRYIE